MSSRMAPGARRKAKGPGFSRGWWTRRRELKPSSAESFNAELEPFPSDLTLGVLKVEERDLSDYFVFGQQRGNHMSPICRRTD
jgi:hypothetical protein